MLQVYGNINSEKLEINIQHTKVGAWGEGVKKILDVN